MLDSRLGKVFIILYTLFAIGVYVVIFSCGLSACGHYIVLPIMPWAYIFAHDFGLTFPWAIYPVLALLNVSVVYAVGVGVEWLYHTYKDRKAYIMFNTSSTTNTERGNAVTLTLLGLAVAILAGVTVLYFIGKHVPQPVSNPTADEKATSTDESLTEEIDPRKDWNTYRSDEYEFSMMYPQGWIIATGTVLGAPVITLYDATQKVASSSTFGIHELPMRVSVYPEGVPLEGSGEQKTQSKTIVPVPQASAMDYVLGTGKPWATVVNFEQQPKRWNESGFVYGRIAIQEEELAYMRGDTGISPEEFDPYSGDTLVTYGFVDSAQWDVMSEMLRSFSFTDGEEQKKSVSDLITVTSPTSESLVSSPLLVRGEANGSWYFEASFPVRLVGADGQVLAEVPATALDDWMQDAPVPFEVSLVFDTPTATSGTLILMRDNPSGLPENDASLEIPVLFGK